MEGALHIASGSQKRFVICERDVIIHNRYDLGLGCGTWDAGELLAYYAEWQLAPSGQLQGASCIELGCGTGLLAIALVLLGAAVDATDLPEVLPVTAANLRRNVPASLAGGQCRVLPYRWGTAAADLRPPYRYIFVADCIYRDAPMPELVRSLLLLSDAATEVFVGYKWRAASPLEEYNALVRRYFAVREVPTADLQRLAVSCGFPLDLDRLHLHVLRRLPAEGPPASDAADL
eukprot:EG_transcript_22534